MDIIIWRCVQGSLNQEYAVHIRVMSLLAGCVQNTVTGNLDSCSTDACICKVGFAGLGCCECDLNGVNGQHHYLDPVTKECTRESIVSIY